MKKYISSKMYKEFGPVAYRQWRAESHCKLIHGYALSFYFEFECDTLDARNWAMDFGGLADLKQKLKEWFDHTCLIALDDPEIETFRLLQAKNLIRMIEVEKTGCEGLADFLYEYINYVFLPDLFGKGEAERLWCCKVQVRETEANMAMVVGSRPTKKMER